MNKLTLLLNDKEIIAEIAKDPDVRIKIKDAIADGIKRRMSKGLDLVTDKLRDEMKDELFDRTWSSHLKPQYSNMLREEAVKCVRSVIKDDLNSFERLVKEEFDNFKSLVRIKIENIDMDEIIRKETERVIVSKLERKLF